VLANVLRACSVVVFHKNVWYQLMQGSPNAKGREPFVLIRNQLYDSQILSNRIQYLGFVTVGPKIVTSPR
jgi:hypothetical protein